jgi:hypothetical protein
VSLLGYRNSGINFSFEDLDGRKEYSAHRQYSRSKLANVLFTQELAERVKKVNPNARVLSLRPGVGRTEILKEFITGWNKAVFTLFSPVIWLLMKDTTSGSQTTLYTVYEKAENLKNGGYYDECKLSDINPFAKDPQNQKILWQRNELILKI